MPPPVLRLADDLTLPVAVVTESLAILGRRGAGKSNTAVILAEEMFTAGVPWVAIDPKGDWYGIRSNTDGTGPGLPIPVFGGLHADVPLEANAGGVVADLVVDENLTAVLDVSDFTKADRARFLVGFFDRLYQRHRAEPQARHVFMEEAHEFIPQQMGREDGRLKEASARIVLQGRSFGLGSSVCSQRSARIHKDVLTQTSILFAMWTTGPQDRKAIEAWVTEHDAGGELVTSLPTLEPGEGWIWATPFDLMRRTRFRRRNTFDSGSTPVLGKARKVATIADVDTAAITAAMAETIERAKEDDPKELRTRIKQLQRELAAKPSVETETVEVEKISEVEVPVFDEDLVVRLEQALEPVAAVLGEIQERLTWSTEQQGDVIEMTRQLNERTARRTSDRTAKAAKSTKPQVNRTPRRDTPPDIDSLGKGETKILTAIAQHPDGVTRPQLSVLTDYKRSSRDTYLQRLRSAELVEQHGDRIVATEVGLDTLGDFEPLPTGADLREYWLDRLPEGERRILEVLVAAYPDGVTRDEISDRTEYRRSSRDTYIQRMKAKEIIRVDRDVYAADHLFDT